jgi:hypothetical protein
VLAGVLGGARPERPAFNPFEAVPRQGGAEDMEVLILLTLLIALDLAAWRWGHDSRDGHDWRF